MHRYMGEVLPDGGRIALIASDALGNFTVATSVVQALRQMHLGCSVDGFFGPRVREFAEDCRLFDMVSNGVGVEPREVFGRAATELEYDLVVNLESESWSHALAALLAGENGLVIGRCLGRRGEVPFGRHPEGRLWADPDWRRDDLRIDFPFLSSGHIAEIFCRGSFWDGPIPNYLVARHDPGVKVPDVLISLSAGLAEKLWPQDRWFALVQELIEEGRSVGLVGAEPSFGRDYWFGVEVETALVAEFPVLDLRGELSLAQVAGALSEAQLVVSIDNGILHLAAATAVPTVGIFRHGIHRLWAPPVPNLRVVEPGANRSVADIPLDLVRDRIKNFQIQLA